MNPTKGWKWVKSIEGNYLQSELLFNNGFEHGFFTREWDNLPPKELSIKLDNDLSIHLMKQVHGDKVIKASSTSDSNPIKADGLISDNMKQSLWVYTADCIPVLIGNRRNGIVSACHVGWRGVSNNILSKVVKKMDSANKIKESLFVALGPAISGKNYQVSLNVAESIYDGLLLASEKESQSLETKDKLNRLYSLGIISSSVNPNKVMLDIRLAAANQFFNLGINNAQLSISPFCTYSNENLFNSWRRNQVKSFQWSGIASKTIN